MSGPQHRLNRHMGAVSAGLEASNLRMGVSAGLEVMEVMGMPPRRTQEQIWAD